jgi:hypothetical protein
MRTPPRPCPRPHRRVLAAPRQRWVAAARLGRSRRGRRYPRAATRPHRPAAAAAVAAAVAVAGCVKGPVPRRLAERAVPARPPTGGRGPAEAPPRGRCRRRRPRAASPAPRPCRHTWAARRTQDRPPTRAPRSGQPRSPPVRRRAPAGWPPPLPPRLPPGSLQPGARGGLPRCAARGPPAPITRADTARLGLNTNALPTWDVNRAANSSNTASARFKPDRSTRPLGSTQARLRSAELTKPGRVRAERAAQRAPGRA